MIKTKFSRYYIKFLYQQRNHLKSVVVTVDPKVYAKYFIVPDHAVSRDNRHLSLIHMDIELSI